ncbi:2-isopropylmalate synthase [Botryosphaeria dothidea]|uniref:2-isopropylmalate synthase n=1 Tax=Botryosphaeria dothidea TaxID=55169 RepID=A0A8H4IGZ0_9PEZI|nr:2-isopropylmalate synthase [Botryosphaeria dothidea]
MAVKDHPKAAALALHRSARWQTSLSLTPWTVTRNGGISTCSSSSVYKEIEVSFPSASQTDFDFTQKLVKTPGTVPGDVWLQVLSPCRKELIRRTVDSLKGAKKAILHLYLATSPCFQQIVFNMNNEQTKALAVECTRYARSITKDDPEQAGTEWANPDFALEVCEAVKAAWEPTVENPIIFNLPATVEMATPNVYADQIEYFSRNISEREKVCISLHPHNDRGTLFGNGERTGNVDLVTLGLNLYTQGIHPKIDFSDLPAVIDVVERANKIPVHTRAPRASQKRKAEGATDSSYWQVPYLPLDPQDIGRTYEAIIRVNSQSGKGGVAWIIQRELELDLPSWPAGCLLQNQSRSRRTFLAASFVLPRSPRSSRSRTTCRRTPGSPLIDYDILTGPFRFRRRPAEDGKTPSSKNLKRLFSGVIEIDEQQHQIKGVGNGAISSLANALKSLGIELDVTEYKEHAIWPATYIECSTPSSNQKVWGVGIHEDVVQASLIALLSAASSFLSSRPSTPIPFRPKQHGSSLAPSDISPLRNSSSADGPESIVANLERKVNGDH